MLFISRLFIHYTNIKIYIFKSLSVTGFTNNIVKLENNKEKREYLDEIKTSL